MRPGDVQIAVTMPMQDWAAIMAALNDDLRRFPPGSTTRMTSQRITGHINRQVLEQLEAVQP